MESFTGRVTMLSLLDFLLGLFSLSQRLVFHFLFETNSDILKGS